MTSRVIRKVLSSAAIVALALFLFACGSSTPSGAASSPDASPAGNEAQNEAPADANSLERLLYTSAWAGYLVVHFDESLAVRQDLTKAIYSRAGYEDRIALIRDVIAQVPAAAIFRAIDAPEEKIEEQRQNLERLSGEKLIDWNSIYHVTAATPDDALRLMRELKEQPGVVKVYPGLKGSTTGLSTTPDLSGQQQYLLSEATYGGLNAAAGWLRGANGQEIYVVDNEPGTNVAHEDLGQTADFLYNGGSFLYTPDCHPDFPYQREDCPSSIAHGTAVAGILVADHNDHGIKGFAPNAHYVHATMAGGTSGDLQVATDNIDDPLKHNDDNLEPGTVWVIEVQLPGKFATSCGSTPETEQGCLPIEVWPNSFAAIQQATAYGVTVVEGGGNGSTDLGNPDLYTGEWSFAHNLATEDAGAIMVGASQGANKQKISYSNCGTRMNAFAWGAGVVTTTYPTDANWGWQGTPPSGVNTSSDNPNNWYMNNFGGTSSAAAMVGGAVAQIQGYARENLGHKRYIMPLKMREIVVGSGVAQTGGGCNIGKQPRVDQALDAVDAFLASVRTSYPELDSDEPLTQERMIALRQLGIGLICGKADIKKHVIVGENDPACPELELWPPGNYIAKDLDFDGDGRADLVQWTNGTWRLDLSSRGPGGDNYGAWDIEISYPPIDGEWVWPYVADMNSDGRTDFVVYDKEHGTFYVAFTDTALLRDGTWHGWDWVIDYSAEWHDDLKLDPLACTTGTGPNCSNYSRPMLGDYNGDGWNDIAIACSDGIWRIDHGGQNQTDLGVFDLNVRYLSDEQLAQAPGWAYTTTVFLTTVDDRAYLSYRIPDGLSNEGQWVAFAEDDPTDLIAISHAPHMFGTNADVLTPGFFGGSVNYATAGLKDAMGDWSVSPSDPDKWLPFEPLPPSDIWGKNDCRPIVGYFDGDDVSDRAVMCPEGWKIAYSGSSTFAVQRESDGSRLIPLSYDPDELTLPGRSYSGGITYEYARQLIEFFQRLHPDTPPPIPVDMFVTP